MKVLQEEWKQDLWELEGNDYKCQIDEKSLSFILLSEDFHHKLWKPFLVYLRTLRGYEQFRSLAEAAWNGRKIELYSNKGSLENNGLGYIIHKVGRLFALETQNRQFLFYQSDNQDQLIILGSWQNVGDYLGFLKNLSDCWRNVQPQFGIYSRGGWLDLRYRLLPGVYPGHVHL